MVLGMHAIAAKIQKAIIITCNEMSKFGSLNKNQ